MTDCPARRDGAGWGRYRTALFVCAAFVSPGLFMSDSVLRAQEPDQDAEMVRMTARLLEAETKGVLRGALIELSGLPRRYVTGTDGRVTFEVPPGYYTLTARKGGYATLRGDFRVMLSGELTFLMHEVGDVDTSIPGRLLVRVAEFGSGRPIEGASVSLPEGRARMTDGQGWVEFRDVSGPVAEVTVGALGYEKRTEPVPLHEGRTTVLEVAMSVDAVILAPLEVTAQSRYLEKQGVYWRIDRNRVNKVLTREEMMERGVPYLSEAFRIRPGVRVEHREGEAILLGLGGCEMKVWMDGWPLAFWGLNIDDVDPEDLALAEVFWAERTPARFDVGGCGAVVFWSKRRAGEE